MCQFVTCALKARNSVTTTCSIWLTPCTTCTVEKILEKAPYFHLFWRLCFPVRWSKHHLIVGLTLPLLVKFVTTFENIKIISKRIIFFIFFFRRFNLVLHVFNLLSLYTRGIKMNLFLKILRTKMILLQNTGICFCYMFSNLR